MKLAIGTVQFGLSYGVANRTGKVDPDSAAAILRCAARHGIDTIDTASSYGDSEYVLGGVGVRDWLIVSKLPLVSQDCPDVCAWVREQTVASLQRLRVKKLHALLLHQPQQLLGPAGARIRRGLERLKEDGLIDKAGVSIYDPAELASLTERMSIEIVQAPFNLIDRRLLDSGWLARLQEREVEVHVRSVFLQGLLLMSPGELPAKFERWRPLWVALERWVTEVGTSRLAACLQFALGRPEIDRVVVGVDSLRQLEQILASAAGALPAVPEELRGVDADLLNPSRWSQL